MQTVYDREVTLHSRNVQGPECSDGARPGVPPSFTNRLMRAKHSPAHGGGLPLWRCAAGRCCVRSVCMEGHAAGSECSSRSGRSCKTPELPNGCEGRQPGGSFEI